MENSIKKLNLGCGAVKKPGYINIDIDPVFRPDIIHDLETFPYPFQGDTFDRIEADHILEHLGNAFGVVRELHRISKNNGTIVIKVPHFSRGFTHSEHKRGFDVTFAYYFTPSFTWGYQGVELKLEKTTLHWFAQPYLKKTVLPKPAYYFSLAFGKILDILANASPIVCSRIWCFWVGGFEEIEFIFRVTK